MLKILHGPYGASVLSKYVTEPALVSPIEKPEIHITFIILPPFQTTSPFQIDHSIKDIELIPLELINSDRDSIRKVREGFLRSKGKTPEPYGMNRRDEI